LAKARNDGLYRGNHESRVTDTANMRGYAIRKFDSECLKWFFFEIYHRDLRTQFKGGPGHRITNTLGCPCNDDDVVLKRHHVLHSASLINI
jgi:hypothetical protein